MTHQVALTVIAKIKPGEIETLRKLLGLISKDVGQNKIIPFAKLSKIHFARFVILAEAKDLKGNIIRPSLVFSSNIDAPLDRHLQELVEVVGEGIDQIFSHCEGYPIASERTRQSRLTYLRAHQTESQAFYVNTVGRPVKQIRQEAELRDQIEDFLDQQQTKHRWWDWGTGDIRKAIQDLIRGEKTLTWAENPAAEPSLLWRVKETLHFLFGALLILALLPIFLLISPIFFAILRYKETKDAQENDLRLSKQERGALALREDHVVQNQFSAVGLIKPGWFRQITVRVLLWLVNFTCRHIFNQGNLAGIDLLNLDGVDTIHFARWIIIDEGRRLLFCSNYDGSLESYMNDFINKVAWGLNAVFSNGVGYPKTRWLVLDGAKDEQAFKAFIRQHQIVTQVWYTAYPQLTAVNIGNNAQIRAGISQNLNQEETEEWLRRF